MCTRDRIYGVERIGIPPLGSTGCAIATTAINWVSCALGLTLMVRHSKLREFGIFSHFCWPQWHAIRTLLKLWLLYPSDAADEWPCVPLCVRHNSKKYQTDKA